MENNQNNTGLFPRMPVCEEALLTELSNDFSLPDYKCEIKKLLSTKATVLPSKEYLGNGGATLEGEIIYKILYVGSDDSLYSATLSDKYKFDAPFEFDSHSVNTDEVTLHYHCECGSVSTRVLGPRKLNVKSRLNCYPLALSPSLYKPRANADIISSTVENLVLTAPSMLSFKCESEPVTLNDLIPFDPQIDNVRIIDTFSRVMIDECLPQTDKITVRGECFFKILYCNDAQSELALTLLRKYPFSVSIPCEGISKEFECCAVGRVIEENASVNENGIGVEIVLTVTACAQSNESVSYIFDAFSTERQTEAIKESACVLKSVKAANGNLTLNDVLEIKELKLDPDAKLIDADACVCIRSVNCENGKAILIGECRYQIIYALKSEYHSCETASLLKYELDIRGAELEGEPCSVRASAVPFSVRARSDGERLFVDCELNFCISLCSKYRIELLKELTFGEKLLKRRGEMILCYPSRDATLWSVAKQYGEPLQRLRDKNALSENGDISKRKYLVI